MTRQLVKRMVVLGVTLDVIGSEKMTPLHYACRSQLSSGRQHFFFCRYGRNVTERCIDGRTETEADDGLDTVKVLVEEGASLTKVSKKLQ